MKNGISDEIWQKIATVYSVFPEIETAILYGSRAKGNYKKGSDVDIVFKGTKLNGKIVQLLR